ncbi:receptor-like protein kinase [Tanacetum coccineum]
MDVKTTFLNCDLEEEVYMNQPEGFVMPSNEHKVSSSSPSLICHLGKLSHVDPCLWVGVVCDPANLQVVTLDLSDSQISGEVGPEISHLTQLKSLNLSFNDFSGPIPSQIGNCTRLQYLDLSVNSLSGNIPNTLGNLLTLKHLNLGTNSLNGSIPEYIFHIPTLEILALSLNRLTGFIPSNLGMQPCSKNCLLTTISLLDRCLLA